MAKITDTIGGIFTKKDPELKGLQADYDASRELQEAYDEAWKLNLSFLAGDQWVRYNRIEQTIDRVSDLTKPGQRKRRRPVHNMITPRYEIVTSKLTSYLPKMVAVPGSPDQEDINAGRVATGLGDYQRRVGKLDCHIRNMADIGIALGTAAVIATWNPYAQAPAYVDEYDEYGQPTQTMIEGGEVTFKALMPWQLIPDPTAYSPEEMKWAEILNPVDPKEAAEIWGKPESYFPATDDFNKRGLSDAYASSPFAKTAKRGYRRDKPRAIEHHRFDLPCKKYPNGRWVVWTEAGVLYSGDLPYGMREFPFYWFTYRRTPGGLFGEGLISGLRQMQMTRNFILGRMAERRDMVSCPPMLIPEGSIPADDWQIISGDPGAKIRYYPGAGEPHFMSPPAPEPMQEMALATGDLDQNANIPAVMQGVSPARERVSGAAVDSLRAEAQEAMGKGMKGIISALEHMGKVALYVGAEKYGDTRIFYVLGKQRSRQWFAIGGTPQGVQPSNTLTLEQFRKMVTTGVDMMVEADPGIPMTVSERRRETISIFQTAGQIPPPLWPALFEALGHNATFEDTIALLGMGAFSQQMGQGMPSDMISKASQQAQGGGAQGGQPPAGPNLAEIIQQLTGNLQNPEQGLPQGPGQQ